MVNICPKCNNTIAPDKNFCGFCGYNIDENIKITSLENCPQCDNKITPGKTFCAFCGYSINIKEKSKKYKSSSINIPIKKDINITYIIIAAIFAIVLLIGFITISNAIKDKNTPVVVNIISTPVPKPTENLAIKSPDNTSVNSAPPIGNATWQGTIGSYSFTMVIYEKYNSKKFKGKTKIYWPEKACSSLFEGEYKDGSIEMKEPFKRGNGKFLGSIYLDTDAIGRKVWRMRGKYMYYHTDIAKKFNNGKPYEWILEKISDSNEL